MFRFSQSRLLPVRMIREKAFHKSIIGQSGIVILSAIKLFIYRLQFGMEKPKSNFGKPFFFYHQPSFQLIAGDVIFINRFVQPSMSIGIGSPDGRNYFIVFIGDGIRRCLVGNRIYLFVNGFFKLWIGFFFMFFEKIC